MFFKPATIATAALATLAAATPTRVARTGPPSSNCGSTTIECCTHVGTATELKSVLTPLFVGEGLISGLLVKLGLVDVLAITAGIVGSVNAVLGLTCSSIAIGGSCTAQQVCCENVVFNGLINVGCVAIDIL